MAQNVYETMVILDSNKYAQDPNGLAGLLPSLIGKCGGEVLVSRLWNEQKLAYPIDGHKKGTYWLTYFRLDSQKLSEFTREIRISEMILRHMTLKVEPRLVDALIEHAKTGGKAKTIESDAPQPAHTARALAMEVPEEAGN